MGDWRHRAACRDEDPELFHPIGNGAPNVPQIREARQVCVRCPVTADCLDEALARPVDGIWGGMTRGERDAIDRRRRRQHAKATTHPATT